MPSNWKPLPGDGKRFNQKHLCARIPQKKTWYGKSKPNLFVRHNPTSSNVFEPFKHEGNQSFFKGYFLLDPESDHLEFAKGRKALLRHYIDNYVPGNVSLEPKWSVGVNAKVCTQDILDIANQYHDIYMRIPDIIRLRMLSSSLAQIENLLGEAGRLLREALDAYNNLNANWSVYDDDLRYQLAKVHDEKLLKFYEIVYDIHVLADTASSVYSKVASIPGSQLETVLKSATRPSLTAKDFVQDVHDKLNSLDKAIEEVEYNSH